MRALMFPSCLEELFCKMEQNPTALLLAGGTDLLVRLRRQPGQNPPPLISLANLKELHGISKDDTTIAIGAATTFSAIIADKLIGEHAPLLAQAARTIGGPAIRNMATIGGNIRTASPAGDSLPPLYLLGAMIEIISQRGKRLLPIGEFIVGPGQTALFENEIITRILLPCGESFHYQGFEKVGRRRSMAIAVTSFACLMNLSNDRTIETARFAWGSVGHTVVRIPVLEEKLAGSRLDDDTICHATHIVRDKVSPISDIRATADYRRSVAANLMVGFMESLRA